MDIPGDKRFFRIGEVSRIIGVRPYVLRYWEKEFSGIRPKRADSRQRVYKREDIETIGEIKRLLYEERLTIKGVKQRLKALKNRDNVPPRDLIEEVKKELNEILHILK